MDLESEKEVTTLRVKSREREGDVGEGGGGETGGTTGSLGEVAGPEEELTEKGGLSSTTRVKTPSNTICHPETHCVLQPQCVETVRIRSPRGLSPYVVEGIRVHCLSPHSSLLLPSVTTHPLLLFPHHLLQHPSSHQLSSHLSHLCPLLFHHCCQ